MSIGPYLKRQPFAEAAAAFAPGVVLTEMPDCLMWTLGGTYAQAPVGKDEFRDAEVGALHSIARRLAALAGIRCCRPSSTRQTSRHC